MQKSTKIIIVLSLFLLISDLTFVFINYYGSKTALEASAERLGNQAKASFGRTLASNISSMQMIATYVANNPVIIDLFWKGKHAVLEEGGGAGGPKADRIRKDLYNYLEPSWGEMTKKFNVRQLHFHLGPGSLSFLRVHRPDKYGDRMDEVRYTVVDVNQYGTMVGGFETGRVYSGIRGVVPVFRQTEPGKEKELIGALEAGSSFNTMLGLLEDELQAALAVFLTKEHVEKNVWTAFREEHYPAGPKYAGHYLETCTCTKEDELLSLVDEEIMHGSIISKLKKMDDGRWINVIVFPLRDYHGIFNDTSLPDIGKIAIYQYFDKEHHAFVKGVRINIFYAVLGYIVAEILIIFVVRFISKSLNEVIDTQTIQLIEAFEETKKASMEGERLKTVNKLAATIAHEFNNPLAIIRGNCELYETVKKDDPTIIKMTKVIKQHVDKMAALVDRLLKLEKLDEIEYTKDFTIYNLNDNSTEEDENDE